MWESFQPQFGLPATIGSALVSYSQWGGVEGGVEKPLRAEVQILWVGLHRPPALPRQLLTELLILHIRKSLKKKNEAQRHRGGSIQESQPWIQECLGANQSLPPYQKRV